MVNLLAAIVEVTPGPEGDHVVIDPIGPMLMSAVYLFLILLPVVLVLLFFFYKKKLQHQQILAAMDKGLPVRDLLEPPKKKETGWVVNISAGIGLLFVAAAMTICYFLVGYQQRPPAPLLVIPILFAGLGLTRLLRGLFQKKAEAKSQQGERDGNPVTSPQIES